MKTRSVLLLNQEPVLHRIHDNRVDAVADYNKWLALLEGDKVYWQGYDVLLEEIIDAP